MWKTHFITINNTCLEKWKQQYALSLGKYEALLNATRWKVGFCPLFPLLEMRSGWGVSPFPFSSQRGAKTQNSGANVSKTKRTEVEGSPVESASKSAGSRRRRFGSSSRFYPGQAVAPWKYFPDKQSPSAWREIWGKTSRTSSFQMFLSGKSPAVEWKRLQHKEEKVVFRATPFFFFSPNYLHWELICWTWTL